MNSARRVGVLLFGGLVLGAILTHPAVIGGAVAAAEDSAGPRMLLVGLATASPTAR